MHSCISVLYTLRITYIPYALEFFFENYQCNIFQLFCRTCAEGLHYFVSSSRKICYTVASLFTCALNAYFSSYYLFEIFQVNIIPSVFGNLLKGLNVLVKLMFCLHETVSFSLCGIEWGRHLRKFNKKGTAANIDELFIVYFNWLCTCLF